MNVDSYEEALTKVQVTLIKRILSKCNVYSSIASSLILPLILFWASGHNTSFILSFCMFCIGFSWPTLFLLAIADNIECEFRSEGSILMEIVHLTVLALITGGLVTCPLTVVWAMVSWGLDLKIKNALVGLTVLYFLTPIVASGTRFFLMTRSLKISYGQQS